MSLKKKFLKSKPVCKVTFILPAEAANGAKEVLLLGEFNNWQKENAIPMKQKKAGDFTATVDLQAGQEYQFRYLLDNETWENDWEADKYIPNQFGIENSVVITTEQEALGEAEDAFFR